MSQPRTRAWSVAAGAVTLSVLLASCSSSGSTASGGAASGASAGGSAAAAGWSQECTGTSLSVIAEATANSQIIEKLLPDFKDKTGIDVTIEQAPYDSLVQKAVLDFTGNKGTYDVLSIPYEYLGSFAEKGYLAPIDDMVSTPPTGVGTDFSTADIIPGMWKLSSNWKDHWYGMPSNSAVMMMFFRKDLMENPDEQAAFKAKYGYDLAPAKTWAQYKDIAEFFTRPAGATLAGQTLSEPFYGVTLAGKRHVATVLEWMNYAWGQGGDLFSKDGQPALNSPENITALDYEKALTPFAPPGYTSATWDDTTAALQQGTAAESITWGDTAGAMEDTEASKVVGKMGYTEHSHAGGRHGPSGAPGKLDLVGEQGEPEPELRPTVHGLGALPAGAEGTRDRWRPPVAHVDVQRSRAHLVAALLEAGTGEPQRVASASAHPSVERHLGSGKP